jgi:hypothetical protein
MKTEKLLEHVSKQAGESVHGTHRKAGRAVIRARAVRGIFALCLVIGILAGMAPVLLGHSSRHAQGTTHRHPAHPAVSTTGGGNAWMW